MRSNNWWKVLSYSSVIAAVGVLTIWLQWSDGFADPDSYYHIRLAQLIADQQQLIYQFPWLFFTTLREQFTDQHLLYHLLLIPGINWFGLVLGAKVTQVVLVVVLACVYLAVLRRWQLPYAAVATISLFLIGPFTFRMNLVKASALALMVLLLVILVIVQRRWWLVVGISALYVWVHAGFVLAVIVGGCAWLGHTLSVSLTERRLALADPRFILLPLVGCVIGVVINPYWPGNLTFFWQQVVQIGLFNYQNLIEVGAEWYPFDLPNLIGSTSVVMIALIVAIVVAVRHYRVRLLTPTALTLALLSLLLLIMTLRSRRYVEYYLPILWLLVCYWLLPYFGSGQWWRDLRDIFLKYGRTAKVLAVYFTFAIIFALTHALLINHDELTNSNRNSQFQAASAYLAQHAEPNTIIFHAEWDDFPVLFYHNPQNYYIVGLDATFMYLEDQSKYWLWRDISSGKIKTNLADTIVSHFGAHYVFVDRKQDKQQLFHAYLLRDPNIVLEFEDEDTRVFHIVR